MIILKDILALVYSGKVEMKANVIEWNLYGSLVKIEILDIEKSIYTIEYSDVVKSWYKEDKLHRDEGPCWSWANGTREWRINGKLHRDDGPAVEWWDGDEWWCLDGVKFPNEEKWKVAKLNKQEKI